MTHINFRVRTEKIGPQTNVIVERRIGELPWSEMYRRVLNLEEIAIRETLIGLGWTPPVDPNPLADYHEDLGPVLWWKFPIDEPPYSGTPLDSDWPGYHTHWTPIVCPKEPV